MVKTKMHEAAKNGDDALIKQLAKALNVNEKDEVWCSIFAFERALRRIYVQNIFVEFILLNLYYLIHVKEEKTPMHFAAFRHHVETCKILKNLGAIVDMRDMVSEKIICLIS